MGDRTRPKSLLGSGYAGLGENNAKLEEEIEKHETELGREDNKSGLQGELVDATNKHSIAEKAHSGKNSEIEGKLRDKANNAIKHNKLFGDANYNITKIRTDIDTVSKDSYVHITNEQEQKLHNLLKEEPKSNILESSPFNLRYSTIVSKAKELIEKKIQTSAPIQELLNDAALAAWVRTGLEQHRGKRKTCAFCGNILPSGLWEKLDKHFNRESEALRVALDGVLVSVERERERVPNLLKIKKSDFYSDFINDLDMLAEQLSSCSASYCTSLDVIKKKLEKRKENIFTPFTFEEPESVEDALNAIRDSFEKFRDESNRFTASLSANQVKARNKLRLHEVFTFITDIKYTDECKKLETFKKEMDNAEEIKKTATNKIRTKQDRIAELKAQLQDESKGADRVNDYLNNFFGHQHLSLKAVEKDSEDASSRYRFDVIRDNKKAYLLSEGECSLIAFCYFMAKLEDIETKGNQPIIWIDDPISSLDANHIFFAYSLIHAKIVTPEKYEENGNFKKRDRFKQLFISTHNLDFLKYLKRLPGASEDLNKKESKKSYRYFIIERRDKSSAIRLMPKYLQEYVTEFNYLFETIYKCASIEKIDDSNYTVFYNFGNNARKFFEIYLYYKYPHKGMTKETLQSFFGAESIPSVLTDRINNEYSHLAGVFERGATPVEVPEMHTSAKFILQTIKDKDKEQYKALLESIGEETESTVVETP